MDSAGIAEAVAEASHGATLLTLESLQNWCYDGVGVTLGKGCSIGVQGKGHDGEEGMSYEEIPMGRKPCGPVAPGWHISL